MAAEFLLAFGAALGVGALVGIEREHRRDKSAVYAGVRTFPLVSASGFLCAWLGEHFGSPAILAVGIAVIGAGAVAFFYVRYLVAEIGFTTPMALIVTFLAGALIGVGEMLEGLVVAVATTLLLLTKARLHRVAKTLTDAEVMGAVQFVALAFVALPLAAAAQGPYLNGLVGHGRAVDLQWTLFIVAAASGMAFISFIALRKFGPRFGLPAAGALGGVVNSEAATASIGALSAKTPGLELAASAAVLAATSTMLVRNAVLFGIADPTLRLLRDYALILVVPLVVVIVWTLLLARRAPRQERPPQIGLESPFAIKPALTFALAFAAVNAAAFFLEQWLGPRGVYATAIAAVVSSGAVVASAANLVFTGTIPPYVGLITAALATIVSILVKLGVVSFTNRTLLGHIVLPVALAAVAGGVGLLLLT